MTINDFIYKIPKAELHLHIEGSFEPELMFKIAKRNKLKIKFNSIQEIKEAYKFNNLQEFLDIYYEGAGVLIKEIDFYDLTWAYLEKIHQENILHTEIFFDPQTHTERGVSFDTVINGIYSALKDGEKKYGISSKIIMCFLRHLDEKSAFETLKSSLSHKDKIIGVGLDSGELGNPPSKFKNVFEEAIKEGFLTVAHAGEEGPSEYVWEALELLKVSRIDHGNRSLEDDDLILKLAEEQIPLTLCPLSNLKLQVIKDMKDYPLLTMMFKNLMCTINSDDPAYFGGYLSENYIAITESLELDKEIIYQLAKNSFIASYLTKEEKEKMIKKIDLFYIDNK